MIKTDRIIYIVEPNDYRETSVDAATQSNLSDKPDPILAAYMATIEMNVLLSNYGRHAFELENNSVAQTPQLESQQKLLRSAAESIRAKMTLLSKSIPSGMKLVPGASPEAGYNQPRFSLQSQREVRK